MKKVLLVILCSLLMVTSAACSQSKSFPTEPIEFYVASAAGGGSDLIARALASEMKLSQSVVVVNRGGAGGTIGTTEVAKAKPDGYSILLGMVGPFETQPHLNTLQYTVDDFRHISALTYEPLFLAVKADSPWKTVEDMKNDLKKSGKKLMFGSSGAGSVPHLAQEVLYKKMEIAAEHVPFEGSNPAITAIVGGHIDAITAHLGEIISQVNSGQLKILGIYSPERFELAPEVPTMKEQGYDIDLSAVKFVSVPKDVPEAVVKTLVDAIEKAKKTESFKEFLKNNYSTASTLTEAELTAQLKLESGMYKQVIEELGLGAK